MSALPNVISSKANPDLWAFRDGKKELSGKQLIAELLSLLAGSAEHHTSDDLMNALIRAGEIESALADLDFRSATSFASVTDLLASSLLGGTSARVSEAQELISHALVPEVLTLSPPEGFSYYALHPLDFANTVVKAMAAERSVAVIGIRSIGTTLSAVATATLRKAGHVAERITIRPKGHPYDRLASFNEEQLAWIRDQQNRSAAFLVVDEGPGRSGSTFLSVGEALERVGVQLSRITLIGSRLPDLDQLCASRGADRWRRFHFIASENNAYSRFSSCRYVGGGEWRKHLLPHDAAWPASWPQMERLKFLSPDRKHLFKFEGLGRIGAAAFDRAQALARAGFTPRAEHEGDGFLRYPVQPRPLSAADLSRDFLERAAQYCAFRDKEFRVQGAAEQLIPMLRFNVEQEFGVELRDDLDDLQPSRAVLTDARMQPYEWLWTASGDIVKADCTSHGDDHFFPGPTDIAWDLAGLAVEWQLPQGGIDCLLDKFQVLDGDDVRRRFPLFVLAYSVVRLATLNMSLTTVVGTPEEARLQNACRFYRNHPQRVIPEFLASSTCPTLPHPAHELRIVLPTEAQNHPSSQGGEL